MISLKACNYHHHGSLFPTVADAAILKKLSQTQTKIAVAATGKKSGRRRFGFRIKAEEGGNSDGERRTFLSLEEAGLVEISGLDTHERFLCRLTISSLNLLRVIAEEEGCSIEELNAGKLCDWFLKDKLKREQNLHSAVLQWDDSEIQF